MSKLFKKAGDLSLINGGYLSGDDGAPLNHKEFVTAQREAHYLVTLAAKMKGKTFEVAKVDNIADLIAETKKELSGTADIEFVAAPKAPKGEMTKKLEEEALAFIGFHEKEEDNKFLNSKLQAFKIVKEFEDHGLFFKKGMVKLEKIYSLDEVIAAAKAVYAVVKD